MSTGAQLLALLPRDCKDPRLFSTPLGHFSQEGFHLILKSKAWAVRGDARVAHVLIKALPRYRMSVCRAFWPEQPAARGRRARQGLLRPHISALLRQRAQLPPARCSTSSWTELHHVVLQTVNSCIIAWFVHTEAVATFDTGLGQVCSWQRGRSGAEALWVVSCCNPGH